MISIVLIQPGATEFDDQGRIMGTLDLPLSEQGIGQVAQAAGEVAHLPIETVYSSSSQAARQTAEVVAGMHEVKVKLLERLRNLDLGLWQGKRIEEVRRRQPKVYRQWQEHPETICPPDGEPLQSARLRVEAVLTKLLKKHKSGAVALVVPEPLASLVRCFLKRAELGDLWKAECECGKWELIPIEFEAAVQG